MNSTNSVSYKREPGNKNAGKILAATGALATLAVCTYLLWPSVVTVPALDGLSRADAQQLLAQRHLGADPKLLPVKGMAPDHVVPGSQSIDAGSQVQPNTVIAFTVSTAAVAQRPVTTTTTQTTETVSSAAPQPVRIVEKRVPVIKTVEKPVAVIRTIQKPVYIHDQPSAAPSTLAVASGAAALTVQQPQPGQQVACSGGSCVVAMNGTATGISPTSAARLLVWWKASNDSLWHLVPNKDLRVAADGTWSGSVHLGNTTAPLNDGDSFDLAVSLADPNTAKQLEAQPVEVTRAQPDGLQADTVSGLVVSMS